MSEDWKKHFEELLPEDWDEREKLLDKLYNTNPHDLFISLFLIESLRQIENKLFFEGKGLECVRLLRGVICSLDSEGQEKLKPQLLKLQCFDEGVPYSRNKVERIYQSILNYLHKTWMRKEE